MSTKKIEEIMKPFGIKIDIDKGIMEKPGNHIVRKASDMRGYYADEGALEKLVEGEKDPVHYEVFEIPVPRKHGHLLYCISSLQPGLVGEECFMTRGHYHLARETAELYLCLKGKGFMAMKTEEGGWAVEEMVRGRMVYVPPFWAHRSINTGNEPLISFCVYPGEAGHNYGDIKKEGFPKRVFIRKGKTVME